MSQNITPEQLEAAVKTLASDDLAAFCVATQKDYRPSWHHQVLANKLERVEKGEIDRLMVFMPPRHGKSEMVTRKFPAWYLGKHPEREIISSSYNAELALSFGRKVRNLMMEDNYRTIFPDIEISPDSTAANRFNTKKGGQYVAVGVGGTTTGRGANIIIIDDPIKNKEEADSETYREKVWEWYTSTLYTRLEKPGAIILVLTRWHKDDLAGRLLDAQENGGDQWEVVNFPAIAVEDEERRHAGEALWPVKYNLEELYRIRSAVSKSDWSSLYQQNPIDSESQEFHEEWFKYYEEQPEKLRIFTAVDPAFKKGKENDESCVMTCGFIEDNMYVLEYTAGKYDPGELISKIIYHIKKWSPEKVGVEAYQAQATIGFMLKSELQKQGVHALVEEITQTGDKEAKIRSLVAPYRLGLIYHKKDMDKLESQLISFPKGKHDDVADALQMVLHMYELQPNTANMTVGTNFKLEFDSFGRPILK